MKKLLLATVALTALAASPAFARTHHSATPMSADPADESYAAAPASGVTAQGPAVYAFGQYAGWDPDPNIRFQLLRDPGDLID
jgi:hypothetical protein